ncbi:MAG TPA: hypothetical protein VJM12_08425 [Pyrinomonadaceae bacterium]|nr:hypothetical protein [Pyrinomonadaceae bacterium]
MCTRFKFIVAAGFGGALLYLFDVDRITRRRALLLVGSVIGAWEVGRALAASKNSKTTARIRANSKTHVLDRQEPTNLDTSFDQTFDYWSHPRKLQDVTSHLHEIRCPSL